MAKLYVVGIGSGNKKDLTLRAREVLSESQVVVGYSRYIDFIEEFIDGKIIVKLPMRSEIERCRAAIDMAKKGYKTSLISSGDTGLYGMAGLLLEMCDDLEVEIVPGVTAAFLAASVLGAPIMQDFCAISLSDHLVSWNIIEERIEAASRADFVIVFYNPRSMERPHNLKKAVEIVLKYRDPKVPVGIVRNARRGNEKKVITTLSELDYELVDMNSIIIIGNNSTYVKNGFMITPRGYTL